MMHSFRKNISNLANNWKSSGIFNSSPKFFASWTYSRKYFSSKLKQHTPESEIFIQKNSMNSHKNSIWKYEEIKCWICDPLKRLSLSIFFWFISNFSFTLLDIFLYLSIFVCNVCVWHRWNEPKDFLFFFCSKNHSTNLNVNFRFAMENVKAEKGISIQFHFIPESWSHLGLRVWRKLFWYLPNDVHNDQSVCMREREWVSEWMCKYLLFALWNGCMHSFQFDWICITFAIFQFFLFSQSGSSVLLCVCVVRFISDIIENVHAQRWKRWNEMWKSVQHYKNVTEVERMKKK